MKEEKKKKESENKIVKFGIDKTVLTDEAIDRIIKESLMKEADELEAELNQDQSLRDADVSDTMFQEIVAQLKEQGIWEEETEGSEKAEEENLEKLYALLPEEDRRALALGKQIEKIRGTQAAKRKKRTKILTYSGVAAAILVLVLSGSMTIEANRRLVKKAWDGMMYNLGFRVSTDYTDEGVDVESRTKEEIAAMAEIGERLGIAVIGFDYMPKGMKYQGYEIMGDNSEAIVFYDYQGKIFSVTMINLGKESVSYYTFDNEVMLRDTIVNERKIEVKIWETNLDKEEETYIATIEHNDCRYILNGMISMDEMKKIVKYAFIL